MILGTLRTRVLEDHSLEVPEGGFFELEVDIDEGLMQRSGDPKSFAYTHISAFLSSAVLDTQVPIEAWTFEFETRPARRYGFPTALNFGVSR
jgi:hypothetical protein